MKRVLFLFSLFLCLSLFSGCAGATDVSAKIAQLGQITANSGAQLAALEESYNRLNFFAKRQVENYGVLQAARALYDEIVMERNRLNSLADSIGNITIESEAALRTLQTEYHNSLQKYGAGAFADFQQRLKRMEDDFAQSELASWLEQAKQLCSRGQYDEALSLVEKAQSSAHAAKFQTLCAQLLSQCKEGIARKTMLDAAALLEKQDPFGALTLLSTLDAAFRDTPSYKSTYEAGIAALEKQRPKNGTVLQSTLKTGEKTLTVTGAKDTDMCIKLENTDDPGKYILFYVHRDKAATVKIPDGSYTMKYIIGEYWGGIDRYFFQNCYFYEANYVYRFTYAKNPGPGWQISFQSTFGGNVTADTVSPDTF